MQIIKKPSNEKKDVEHLGLCALIYAARLQLQVYLNLTLVDKYDKLTYQNAKNALKQLEKKLTGKVSILRKNAVSLTKNEKTLLSDTTSLSGICSRKFARAAGLIGNENNEYFYEATKAIIEEIAAGVPEKYKEYAALLKEEDDE